jgi:hypothetical protein
VAGIGKFTHIEGRAGCCVSFFFERKVGILLIGIGNIYIQEDRRVPQPDMTARF